MPHSERHAEGKFWKSTEGEAPQKPQTVLGIWDQDQVTDEKSQSASDQQKGEGTKLSCRHKKQGKKQVELDKHGEVPPRGIQIHKVHGDIDEAQTAQAQEESVVDRFDTRDKRGDQVNEMRDPVHRIKTEESREVPGAPLYRPLFGFALGRLRQGPATENDENADGVEAEAGDLEPRQPEKGEHAGGYSTPIGRRQRPVFEVSPEKMKIDDPKNGQPFCDIEPEKSLHWGEVESRN